MWCRIKHIDKGWTEAFLSRLGNYFVPFVIPALPCLAPKHKKGPTWGSFSHSVRSHAHVDCNLNAPSTTLRHAQHGNIG